MTSDEKDKPETAKPTPDITKDHGARDDLTHYIEKHDVGQGERPTSAKPQPSGPVTTDQPQSSDAAPVNDDSSDD